MSLTETSNEIWATPKHNLYQHPISSLSVAEFMGENKKKGTRIRGNKKKKTSRLSSPPPANPSTILEYKLFPGGKVHIPFGHPQIDSVQNKSRIEIVSKDPQIKIVYPDDPENSLLMLQQQNVSEQLSVLQDGFDKNPKDTNLQETTLHEEYEPGSTTIVITEAIEDNERVSNWETRNDKNLPTLKHSNDKSKQNDSEVRFKDTRSTFRTYASEGNGAIHFNQVHIVDAEGNINEQYYIS